MMPKDGKTPLHYAAENGNFEICQLIIDEADDKNPKMTNGDTALHMAARKGYLAISKLIIECAVDKNPDNVNGWTPLHQAAKAGHLKVCQLIIDNVDDKNPENFISGITPLQLASKRKNSEIVELIQTKLGETKLKDALIPYADEI